MKDQCSDCCEMCSGQDTSKGESLKKRILRSLGDLPAVPQTVFKARELLSDSNSSFGDLATVIGTDQALCVSVLRLANSSYYGLSGKVSSIKHASMILGQKNLAEVITMAGASGLLGKKLPGYDLDAGDLWRHSLAVAFGSKMIADKKNSQLAHDAFSAGLIHDVGKLILDRYVLESKEAFSEFMSEGHPTFLEAEKRVLGLDHAEIASEICRVWKVPAALATAIRYHHNPGPCHSNKCNLDHCNSGQFGGSELAKILHVADVSAMMTGLGLGIDGMMYEMNEDAVKSLGLKWVDVSAMMGDVLEAVEGVTQRF